MFDAGVADEIVADGVILRDDAAGIADMGGEREIEIGAIVDLVDRHQGAFEYFAPHRLIGPGLRAYNTNWNRRLRPLSLSTPNALMRPSWPISAQAVC